MQGDQLMRYICDDNGELIRSNIVFGTIAKVLMIEYADDDFDNIFELLAYNGDVINMIAALKVAYINQTNFANSLYYATTNSNLVIITLLLSHFGTRDDLVINEETMEYIFKDTTKLGVVKLWYSWLKYGKLAKVKPKYTSLAASACNYGKIDILNWLVDNECKLTYEEICLSNAALHNRGETIRWLIRADNYNNLRPIDVKYDADVVDYLCMNNNVVMLNMWHCWTINCRLPFKYSTKSLELAFVNNNKNVILWWNDHGKPSSPDLDISLYKALLGKKDVSIELNDYETKLPLLYDIELYINLNKFGRALFSSLKWEVPEYINWED